MLRDNVGILNQRKKKRNNLNSCLLKYIQKEKKRNIVRNKNGTIFDQKILEEIF